VGEYSIGVDLGGTNLRAAAISEAGKLIDKVSGSTNLHEGREALISDLVEKITTLRDRHGRSGLVGVGVGVPGFIDIEEGRVIGSNNIPELDGVPVRDEVEQRVGVPVVLENDANSAALGECWMGAGREVDDLILLTLGTGVGGGIISGGKVLHGALGMAGEVGHMTVLTNGNPCGCGNVGCLEKHASATAVEAMAHLIGLPDGCTPKDVQALAEQGDERARVVYERMGVALGIALATLISIFNFPLYLLSGGVLPAWDLFAPSMLAEVRRRSFTFRHTDTRIERAALGSEAGLFGASYLPFQARVSRQ
jgi:glucokinase